MVWHQRRKLRLKRLTTHKLWNWHLRSDTLTSNQTACFLLCHQEGECVRRSPICTIFVRGQRALGTVFTVADFVSHLSANPTPTPSSEGSPFIINPTPLYRSKYHTIKFNKPLPRRQAPQNISEGNSLQLLELLPLQWKPTFRCKMSPLSFEVWDILTSHVRKSGHRHRPFYQKDFHG